MVLENTCGPVILYLGFSIVQIIIDLFKKLYNVALLKFLVMIIFAVVLNILCKFNLNIIGWFIVFLPFIFMTFISSIMLFVFGNQQKIKHPNNNHKKVSISCHNYNNEIDCSNNYCFWDLKTNTNDSGKCRPYSFIKKTVKFIDLENQTGNIPGVPNPNEPSIKNLCPTDCIKSHQETGNCKKVKKNQKEFLSCPWICPSNSSNCKYDTDCLKCEPWSIVKEKKN